MLGLRPKSLTSSRAINITLRIDAPKLTRSMHIALEDLALDLLVVIYPGETSYPLAERVTVLPLTTARYGIDIWMTTTALAEGFKLCQSFLGAKIHDAKDPGADLSAMLIQVVSSVFELMGTYEHVWETIKGSEVAPYFGFEYSVGLEPINVNTQRMVDNFRQSVRDLGPVWKDILQPVHLGRIQTLAAREPHSFPDDLWASVVYDFALAYHRRVMNRDHLLGSLTPLYLGRTAAFVIETAEADSDAVEERIESVALAYEAAKEPFVQRWKEG